MDRGVAISLSSDANGITITGRDAYTKTETDNALSLKANASSVYTKDETDITLSEKQKTITGPATGVAGTQTLFYMDVM